MNQHIHKAPGKKGKTKTYSSGCKKNTGLWGHEKLKPGSADEGEATTAMKQRFVRENHDCSHPARTIVTPLVHVYMLKNIGFPFMLFSLKPILRGRGKAPQNHVSWQQTTIINSKPVLSNTSHKAATIWTTHAAADKTRQQQMYSVHTVQETQQYNC